MNRSASRTSSTRGYTKCVSLQGGQIDSCNLRTEPTVATASWSVANGENHECQRQLVCLCLAVDTLQQAELGPLKDTNFGTLQWFITKHQVDDHFSSNKLPNSLQGVAAPPTSMLYSPESSCPDALQLQKGPAWARQQIA